MSTDVITDEQRVSDRCDELLAEFPPASTRPAEVLGAQYDKGLAWVHFPEGFGGLGVSPKLQNLVNAKMTAAGAPLPYGGASISAKQSWRAGLLAARAASGP